MLEIATNQAEYLQNRKDQDEREKEILRSTIKDLQMHDDDKLIIGQLHQHILEVQKTEFAATQNAVELKTKCLRLESTVVNLEKQIDDQDSFIFQLRLKNKSRVQSLRRTLTDMRMRLAGAVLFQKYERSYEMVSKLKNMQNQTCAKMDEIEIKNHELKGISKIDARHGTEIGNGS